MLRITALSDLHGRLPDPKQVPACDLLILAGDICPDNVHTCRDQIACAGIQALWLKATFNRWLHHLPEASTVVMCWGNHDFIGDLPESLWPDLDAFVVREGALELTGLPSMFISSYVTKLPMWALNRAVAVDSSVWDTAPACELLITHAPAQGTGDVVPNAGHCGSPGLRDYVSRVNPKLHVFGHIHEGRGGDTMRHNVAYVDGAYRPYNLPIPTFTLDI